MGHEVRQMSGRSRRATRSDRSIANVTAAKMHEAIA